MRSKRSTSNMLSDLQKANKYIFVQDFDKADTILQKLSLLNIENHEIHFKRIDLAIKSNTLNSLIQEFTTLQKKHPKSKSLILANLLSKIKYFSLQKEKDLQIAQEKKENSTQFFIDSTPLNLQEENKIQDDYDLIDFQKTIFLPNRKIKISRNTIIPDDYNKNHDAFNPLKEIKDKLVSLEFKKTSHEITSFNAKIEEVINHAVLLHKEEPLNAAACYVAGCAFEYLGKMDDAIEKWKSALTLSPNSTSALGMLAELQQLGYVVDSLVDYSSKYESIDKYNIHGHLETHTELYNEFISSGEYKSAIGSLKTYAAWSQKQQGEITIEIEIFCLLGAMKAYKLGNNLKAAESCEYEVEQIIQSHKKSEKDVKILSFIGKLCEEYQLFSMAKSCFYIILSSKINDFNFLLQTAKNCVNKYASKALIEILNVAYKNTHANEEIRNLITICQLNIYGINVENYFELKDKARSFIYQGKINQGFEYLKKLSSICEIDAEVQYYLAEIYQVEDKYEKALYHFSLMFQLDPFNHDGTLRYIFYLLKLGKYEKAKNIIESIDRNSISKIHIHSELLWANSACYFSCENYETSLIEIKQALEINPWDISYITLFLRCQKHLTLSQIEIGSFDKTLTHLEEYFIDKNTQENKRSLDDMIQDVKQSFDFFSEKGLHEIAWAFAKCALLLHGSLSEDSLNIISNAAASTNVTTSIRELILLTKKENLKNPSLNEIFLVIAQVHSLCRNWELMREWLELINYENSMTHFCQAKILELKALEIIFKGKDTTKALNFIEMSIDFFKSEELSPKDLQVIHAYALIETGQFSLGLEKINKNLLKSKSSIRSIYFIVKALDKTGKLELIDQDFLNQLNNNSPKNLFEQKLIEEIFVFYGNKLQNDLIGLAC